MPENPQHGEQNSSEQPEHRNSTAPSRRLSDREEAVSPYSGRGLQWEAQQNHGRSLRTEPDKYHGVAEEAGEGNFAAPADKLVRSRTTPPDSTAARTTRAGRVRTRTGRAKRNPFDGSPRRSGQEHLKYRRTTPWTTVGRPSHSSKETGHHNSVLRSSRRTSDRTIVAAPPLRAQLHR